MNLFGMDIRLSPLNIYKRVPWREHKRRKGQSLAYHLRVQKKWTKRYGTKKVPCILLLNNSVIGGVGTTIAMDRREIEALQDFPGN